MAVAIAIEMSVEQYLSLDMTKVEAHHYETIGENMDRVYIVPVFK